MAKRQNIRSHLVNLHNYELIQEINRGGFGVIFLVEDKKTHQQLAAKVHLQGSSSSTATDQFLSREISILIRVHAPTIIRFFGFSLTDFSNMNNVTMLMEYKENGSLKQLIEKEEHNQSPHEYDNTAKQIILCGIAHGMMVLHSRRVLHRDLKPDNILLDSNYYPYITDFGLSKFLDPDNSKSQSMSGCGTAAYIAPEVLDGNYYGLKSDVYSFGILMYEVVTGCQAYSEEMKKKNFRFISFANKVLSGERPKFTSPIKPSFKKLIEQCWSKNPKHRPSFKTLFHKLSLSLDNEDETIQSSLQDMISDQNEDVTDNSRYCLDDVDYDRLLDYVEEITTVQSNDTLVNNQLKQQIKEQNKRINELEQQHLKYKQVVKELHKKNQKNQQEITSLKNQLIEMNNKLNKMHDTSETQMSSSPSSTQSSKQKDLTPNPLEGLSAADIKKKIQSENLSEITISPSIASIKDLDFSECNSLISVTILPSVKSIGKRAFYNCKSLTQIAIPSSVTSIGEYAFESCSSLSQISIPSSVTFIGEFAFSFCHSITQIAIPSSMTSIGNSAFCNCKSLTKVTIPSSVKSIGEYAFANIDSLRQITIPSSVTSIGKNAFARCSSLTQVTIPSSVITIESYAFWSCSSLPQITIPSSVLSIGQNPFGSCTNLEKIFLDSDNPNFVTIDGVLFTKDVRWIISYPNKRKPTNYTIPSSVTSIGNEAFTGCSSITQIIIPSSVTALENSAFCGCSSLSEITIPTSVTSIGDYAFSRCISLSQITIPSSVTSIGNYAFSSCSLLTQITIPSSVKSIGDKAFEKCSRLSSTIQNELTNRYGSKLF